jgi:FMN phosphatase YigB (HAD superfamily)
MPYALETLKKLKETGIKLAACSNSNTPLKRVKVLESQGFVISELFDAFIVSADVGVRKPNP